MKVLTKESLDAAIKTCQENDRYYVLIVTEDATDINPIVDYLCQIDDLKVARCFGYSWAKFENGSFIRMISTACSARGYKSNLVLCSLSIYENEEIKPFLQAMEIRNIDFKIRKE